MGELFDLSVEAARDPITGRMDQSLLLPRTFIVPKNSNIQLVYPDVLNSIERAKRFKPPFRQYAIALAENHLKGILAVSSEQGAYVREFNTVRGSVPIGTVTGQPASFFDKYVHGKDKLKNNPETNNLGIEI